MPIRLATTPPENATLADMERAMLRAVNAGLRGNDLELRARMHSFEASLGMQRQAPAVFDLGQESRHSLQMYGIDAADRTSFASQCLVARRFIEQGVRCVTLIDTGSGDNWDAHGDMSQHRGKATRVDRAIGALIKDLKQRGLLDETLIVGCTEFGRTPWTAKPNTKGREHHAQAFSGFLAGAGVRGGTAYGATDDHGVAIVRDKVHVHDFHATILHLMGLDYTRLTYRHAGRDFRLTDVEGEVVRGVLA